MRRRSERLIGHESPMESSDGRADCPECWRRMWFHEAISAGVDPSTIYRCEWCNVTVLGLDVWGHL